ncbi:MAG: hypothetical protein HQ463_09180 [Bacteroidetes bacterium]|nr:hypothetical protein [Bacteroidota bacterium]
MTIDIVNGTGCPLDFAWTYGAPGCNFVGPGITVPGSMTITGPCVQDPCDAGVCRCPTRIELQVPGSPIPWSSGDFSSLPIGTTVWDNVRPCGFCPGSGMMRLTITYAGGNNCTFTFTCM